jgi:uncharacterized protein YsxB (DUF464 family)
MISAALLRDAAGFTGCRISGHSGYGEEGSDIVCAAVSILGCTCVNALESVCGVIPVIEQNQDGLISFRLPDERSAAENERAQILMGALRQGLMDLAEGYPRDVQVKMKERRK